MTGRRPEAGPAAPADAPAKERSEGGRAKILRVAATLFSTKGYAESGLREIARQAGIRASTVYHHFESKERIYEEIIRIATDGIADEIARGLAALPADATPRERFETCIAAHLRALHSNKPFTSTNAQPRIRLPDEVGRIISPILDRYSGFWRDLLSEARRGGWIKPEVDTRILRPLILGTLNRTVGWFESTPESIENLVRTTNAMFAGIWREPPPPRKRKRGS